MVVLHCKTSVVGKCQMVDVGYGDLSRFSPSCPSADHFDKYLQPSALSFSKYTSCSVSSFPLQLKQPVGGHEVQHVETLSIFGF